MHDPYEDNAPDAPGEQASRADSAPSVETSSLLGATDIVAAFTALRHEIKLQVRSERDLQQVLEDSLAGVTQRLDAVQRACELRYAPGSDAEDNRQLAEAVAELEERLERVIEALSTLPETSDWLAQFDRTVAQAGWLARTGAGALMGALRAILEQSMAQTDAGRSERESTRQGLQLLLQRVQRLMQQCDLKRVDVLHKPFDAEVMHAVDMVDDPGVPSSHVAEQLRPAYFWRGKVLCYANVRLAR